MSGHSKWSKVKHQKATTDAVKSRAFTHASRAITVAVREGGGISDPEKNFRLRLAVLKAHEVNMPKDTIERAISRALEGGGAVFENLLYEGYGPGGVAVLVESATDNRQRTSSDIKHQFDRAGGSLASPGAVNYQFSRTGILVVEKGGKTFDEFFADAVAAGADDVTEQTDMFEVFAPAEKTVMIKTYLTGHGWIVDNWEIIMRPKLPVSVSEELRMKNEALSDALLELDDVQHVFTNLE